MVLQPTGPEQQRGKYPPTGDSNFLIKFPNYQNFSLLKIFERPEWKKYRTEISKDKKLKLCGKKLPRHCDVNEDRKLTMSEWVDCLGVDLFTSKVSAGNAGSSHTRRPVHRSNGRRNGKNPFTDILKNRWYFQILSITLYETRSNYKRGLVQSNK